MLSFALRGYQILSRLLPLASIGVIYTLWQMMALWLLGKFEETSVILERSEVNSTGYVSEAGLWPLVALVFSIPAAAVIGVVFIIAMRKRQANTRAVATTVAIVIYIFSPTLSAMLNEPPTLATPLLSSSLWCCFIVSSS